MNDENPVEKPERRGSRPTPSENRLKQDRRQTSRRSSGQLASDSERRVGDRRKHERRIIQTSNYHNLVRFLKEKGLYPHEKAYDQPDGAEVIYQGKNIINLASVDYFNFAQDPEIKKTACAAIKKYGAGGFSSRFSMGNLNVHMELEKKLAEFMGKESVLIFNSGYLANLAMITSLMPKNATIFLDQKCHLSIHHACLMSQKKYYRYSNNDMARPGKAFNKHIGMNLKSGSSPSAFSAPTAFSASWMRSPFSPGSTRPGFSSMTPMAWACTGSGCAARRITSGFWMRSI